MQQHALLILGAGWTSTFLIPLCRARNLPLAATTRDGRTVASLPTTPWTFDPAGDATQFHDLPLAKTLLVTFPLTGKGQSKLLKEGYDSVWGGKLGGDGVRVIQLGSTGIWQIPQPEGELWTTRHSPYNRENARAVAEDELLEYGGVVLNLAGLWGGPRQPRNWVKRVAKTKEDVRGKKSLHMIHGQDVARAVLGVTGAWEEEEYGGGSDKVKVKGERWMLTDTFVYDWWALMAGWADVDAASGAGLSDVGGRAVTDEAGASADTGGDDDGGVDIEPAETARWVLECMREEGVRALPRGMEELGRCYDSREFWETVGVVPLKARI